MGFELEASRGSGTLYHAGKACGRERRSSFGREHEWRLGILLPGQAAECPHLVAPDGMGTGCALLGPADRQRRVVEVDLVPAEVDKLRRSEAVPVSQQHH